MRGEGQNVLIEYRSAEDQAHRLPALVDDLVRRQVALIVGNTPSSLAAKAATTTVPIVFVTGNDPIINGLVPSLSRPGGNTTGVSFLSTASVTKRLELLRQLAPKAATIAMLVGPNLNTPDTQRELRDVQAAAHASGQELIVVQAESDRDIETAFATFAQRGAGALFIGSSPIFNSRRERVAARPSMNCRIEKISERRSHGEIGQRRKDHERHGSLCARIRAGAIPALCPHAHRMDCYHFATQSDGTRWNGLRCWRGRIRTQKCRHKLSL